MFGIPVWAAFAASLMAASLLKERCAALVSIVLLANWSLLTIVYLVTGEQFAWHINALVDYVSAIAVLACAGGAWQRGVMAIYVIDLVMHAAFGVSDRGQWAQYYYWHANNYAAWAQALLVWGWVGHGTRKRLRRRVNIDSSIQSGSGLPAQTAMEGQGDGGLTWRR